MVETGHLARALEEDGIVRNKARSNGVIMCWPCPKVCGIASMKACSLNSRVMELLALWWVRVKDLPSAIGIDLLRAEAPESKDVSIPKKTWVMPVLGKWLVKFWNDFYPTTIDPTSLYERWSKFCPSVPSGGWMAPHDGIGSWRHVQGLRWQLGDEALLHTSVKALALGHRFSKGIFPAISSSLKCKTLG